MTNSNKKPITGTVLYVDDDVGSEIGDAIEAVIQEYFKENSGTITRRFQSAYGLPVVFEVRSAPDIRSAFAQIKKNVPAILFLDLTIGEEWGLDLIPKIKRIRPAVTVPETIVLSEWDRNAEDWVKKYNISFWVSRSPKAIRGALEKCLRRLLASTEEYRFVPVK